MDCLLSSHHISSRSSWNVLYSVCWSLWARRYLFNASLQRNWLTNYLFLSKHWTIAEFSCLHHRSSLQLLIPVLGFYRGFRKYTFRARAQHHLQRFQGDTLYCALEQGFSDECSSQRQLWVLPYVREICLAFYTFNLILLYLDSTFSVNAATAIMFFAPLVSSVPGVIPLRCW